MTPSIPPKAFSCAPVKGCTAFFFLLPDFRIPLWAFLCSDWCGVWGCSWDDSCSHLDSLEYVMTFLQFMPGISDNFLRSFLVFFEMYNYQTSFGIFSGIGSSDEDPWASCPQNSSPWALASTILACSIYGFKADLDRLILPSLYGFSTQSLRHSNFQWDDLISYDMDSNLCHLFCWLRLDVWIPAAEAFYCVVEDILDFITSKGVNLVYPFAQR